MNPWLLRSVAFLVAASAVGGFGAMVWGQMNEAMPDAQGCVPGVPTAHNVILVDRSDAMSADAIERMISMLAEVFDATAPGDRYSIYFVGDGEEDFLSDQMSICQPKNGGTVWRRRFRDKVLADQVDSIRKLDSAWLDHSPILESIEALLNRRQVFEAEEVNLWIVSDFLQNGARISFYGKSVHLLAGDDRLPEPQLKLRGRLASVDLLVLPSIRHSDLQSKAVSFFMSWLGRVSDGEPQWEMF